MNNGLFIFTEANAKKFITELTKINNDKQYFDNIHFEIVLDQFKSIFNDISKKILKTNYKNGKEIITIEIKMFREEFLGKFATQINIVSTTRACVLTRENIHKIQKHAKEILKEIISQINKNE